jgi:hypothetical protein
MNPAIARINAMPMADLRFRDFARLKSGRDRHSARGYDDLASLYATEIETISEALGGDVEAMARVLRWRERGLELTRAIRKVKTDLEISGRALSARAERSRRWQELENIGLDPSKYMGDP